MDTRPSIIPRENGRTVLTCEAPVATGLSGLLSRYDLRLVQVTSEYAVPGSYWGECEAGLIGNQVFARPDTPIHSVLHETCHYVCMPAERRRSLHTNAGGDYAEETAVCFLQVLLAENLPGLGRERMFRDMDTWGYSFRLGSSTEWFEHDADDARSWLRNHDLIDAEERPTWRLRQQ